MLSSGQKLPSIFDAAVFSLFHHDPFYQDTSFEYDTEKLYQKTLDLPLITKVEDIAGVIEKIVLNSVEGYPDNKISLTLTGGMDSRVILAVLLKAGIKPNCLTYGNPMSRDVVFAKKLAEAFSLPFHNAVSQAPTAEWYYKWVVETIKRDNGNSHLHRAHRTAAIAEHTEIYHPKVLLTGHMGGEGLRGLAHNNYFASSFYKNFNKGKLRLNEAINDVLFRYFIRTPNLNLQKLISRVKDLSWMQEDKETNRFFFLYDLVGKIHHAQDLRIFSTYVSNVVPVFLQNDYLRVLFSSPFHFLAGGNKIANRLNNPWVHCKLIEMIYPDLLNYPLSNGYNPREYMKGLWFYIPAKIVRYALYRNKYSTSFSYDKWYLDFVKEQAENIGDGLWEIYNKKAYFSALFEKSHRQDEGYWHKFSNPVYSNLVNQFKKGLL